MYEIRNLFRTYQKLIFMWPTAPLEKGSKTEQIVTKIRVRKGLKVGRL
jgi:hypothetical protein